MTQIIPNETNILVEKIVKGTSKGGLILPNTPSGESVVEAKVIAVGPGKLLDNGSHRAVEFKKGDTVLFLQSEYSKKEIDSDGKLYLILNERDILAKYGK